MDKTGMSKRPGSKLETAEQLLSFLVIGSIIVSVVSIAALLIAAAQKSSVWGWVTFVPMFALPIAILAIISVMVVGIINRRRH